MTARKLIYPILTVLLLALAAGCSARGGEETDSGQVSLSLELSTDSGSAVLCSTKADDDYSLAGLDDPDHPENMAVGALAVDGRIMAELIVLIVKDGKIVAYREINKGSPDLDEDNGFLDDSGNVDRNLVYSSRAKVSFSHFNAKHGETVGRGDCKIYAAALPYGDIAEKYYSDLFKGFRQVRDMLNEGKTVDFDKIYATKIDISSSVDGEVSDFPFLYPKVGQWLSGETSTTLHYGKNKARLELLRTAARIRLEITNNSSQPLRMNHLAFSDKFTRKDSWLFSRSDKSLNYYSTDLGAPAVESNRAIISFTGSVENPVIIDSGKRTAVFDGYINENRDLQNPFTYSLSVYYDGMEAQFRADGSMSSSPDDLKDGATFYIGKYQRLEFLYHWFSGTDDRKEIIRTDGGTNEAIFYNPDMNYIWQVEHLDGDADGVFVLRSLSTLHETKSYVSAPEYPSKTDDSDKNYTDPETGEIFNYGSPIVLTDNMKRVARLKAISCANGSMALKVVDRNGNDINLRNSKFPESPVLMNVYGGIAKKDIAFWPQESDALPDNNLFQFYPVHSVVGDATTMTVKENGTAITEIKRNDFIRIHLKVSYNKNIGQFEFEVAPWDSKKTETTFD